MTVVETREVEAAPAQPRKRRSWARWLAGGIAVVGALVVGGPYVYIHFVEGPVPAPLSLASIAPPAPVANHADGSFAGSYTVGLGSVAGYRVRESLFGQPATAVGRTSGVTGTMTIAGSSVTRASFTVDLASITSGRSARDARFRDVIMDTTHFPTASFALTEPIALDPVPGDGVVVHYSATGTLTLHGTTRDVTIPLTAERTAGTIRVQGILSIAFRDYGVTNPSFGPAHVGDRGQLEFALLLEGRRPDRVTRGASRKDAP